MKKAFAACLAAICTLFTTLYGFAAAENIILNGSAVAIQKKKKKIEERDDRTFVPIRFVMENLGCQVIYDDASKSALMTQGETLYIFQVDNSRLFILEKDTGLSKSIEMDTSVYLNAEEGRMYIPIRFLAEAIGYVVGWDDASKTVTLNLPTV